LVVALVVAGSRASAQEAPRPIAAPSEEDLVVGRRLFESQCSRCHGRDGQGGEGPNLKQPRLRRAPDEAALLSVIQDGIRGTSMQGAWQLSPREVARVGAYVRSIGRVAPEVLPGDGSRGRALFEGKGGCGVCHMVDGRGGSLGPDLSEIGAARGSAHLKRALVEPGAEMPARPVSYEPNAYAAWLPVNAVLKNGSTLSGTRINEDSFTIQLRDAAGRLHSLRKSELTRLEKTQGQSSMPAYRGLLSEAEIDDLVAYLAGLRGAS
jgi:putative heme-binding domain-containing protein